MVGLVEHARRPAVAEVAGDHDVRPVPADGARDVPSQGEAVLEHAVWVAEELDHVDADDRGGRALLLLSRSGPARSGSMPSMPASPLVPRQ